MACGGSLGAGSAFRRSGHEATDEVALKCEEHSQRDDHCHERTCRQQVPILTTAAGDLSQKFGDRGNCAVGKDQGHQQVVPHPEELENRECGNCRGSQGQRNPEENLPVACPVDPGGLDDLVGDFGNEVMQQEDRQRQRKDRVGYPDLRVPGRTKGRRSPGTRKAHPGRTAATTEPMPFVSGRFAGQRPR